MKHLHTRSNEYGPGGLTIGQEGFEIPAEEGAADELETF